ncbi:MAG: glycosyltransferase [Chloroflexi bacterium]|nr:glycosyltransferase [Chloroflexota bacterium]
MKVSLAITVLNEGDHIRRLLDSVVKQTRQPDEVVVCDGGSKDNTLDVIREYENRLPLKIVVKEGANISQGRNEAIRNASYEIVAVTDAGVWLEENWLEQLLVMSNWGDASSQLPITNYSLVAGFYQSDPQNIFEIALGATTLPDVEEINPGKFLPSSLSVACLKSAWEAVGGYPEWLDFSEDVVFDLKMRQKFGDYVFAPKAIAHFRPRPTLLAFMKQYFNYAKGDGKANLWLKIHLIRYITYLVVVPLGVYAAWVNPLLWYAGALAMVAYVRRPLTRLIRQRRLSLGALVLVPVIRVAGDVAKMIGYPVGVWWRLGQRIK